MDEYQKKAEEFLRKTNTEFKAVFLKNDFYFDDDKDKRDIYEITLKRGDREYIFKFGNSLNCSGEYVLFPSRERIHLKKNIKGKPILNIKGFGLLNKGNSKKNKNFKVPSAYDVLTCLQKYEVGTFKDFCDEFSYDEDSKKAERTYNAVVKEWENIQRLYNDKEIKLLQDIN